jgi:hypothetical protein
VKNGIPISVELMMKLDAVADEMKVARLRAR